MSFESFEFPALPFDVNALEDWTSAETLAFHHGKHHAGYVKKLNAAVAGSEYAEKSLEEVIAASRDADASVFNNAAQHWNHTFFWNCLSGKEQDPDAEFSGVLEAAFGSVDAFKEAFGKAALTLFGSGWAWLVRRADGALEIAQYKDAETPAGTDKTPLLTLDVWEHAYYIDYRNDRAGFIEGFWKHVNWAEVAKRLG